MRQSLINAHSDILYDVVAIMFGITVHQHTHVVYESRECYGESVHMRRLALALAACSAISTKSCSLSNLLR